MRRAGRGRAEEGWDQRTRVLGRLRGKTLWNSGRNTQVGNGGDFKLCAVIHPAGLDQQPQLQRRRRDPPAPLTQFHPLLTFSPLTLHLISVQPRSSSLPPSLPGACWEMCQCSRARSSSLGAGGAATSVRKGRRTAPGPHSRTKPVGEEEESMKAAWFQRKIADKRIPCIPGQGDSGVHRPFSRSFSDQSLSACFPSRPRQRMTGRVWKTQTKARF